mmetsp:Transcript_11344/g.29489  ORF Transcript_11344/g.29489 Transcript_11344/m.29489 type:complete len:178 (-) Transcript_11344:321-854(-)
MAEDAVPRLVHCLPYHPGKGHARFAVVKHFLPAGWLPAYKFTIFEDSYLVSFVELDMQGRQTCQDVALHLARPAAPHRHAAALSGAAAGMHAHGSSGWLATLPRFELVWPLAMDADFIRHVDQAFCSAALCPRPAKRKGHNSAGTAVLACSPSRHGSSAADLPLEVHAKMRRLSFDP